MFLFYFIYFIGMVRNLVKVLALAMWTQKNHGHDLKRLNGSEKIFTLVRFIVKNQHVVPNKILMEAHFLRYQPQI